MYYLVKVKAVPPVRCIFGLRVLFVTPICLALMLSYFLPRDEICSESDSTPNLQLVFSSTFWRISDAVRLLI